MRRLASIVWCNQLFYMGKVIPVMLICGLILFIPSAAALLTGHIRALAHKPLSVLNTELILQHDVGNKKAEDVRTKGLIEPFNMHSFDKKQTVEILNRVQGVSRYSTALVLWQFDPNNSLTAIGLDIEDPEVGLRKVESLLTPKSRFFSSNDANEILLERHFAKLFGHKPDLFYKLAGQQLKIIGLVDFKEQSNLSSAALFLPYETALTLSKQKTNVINQVFLSLDSSGNMETVSQSVEQLLPDFSLISRDSLYKNLSAFNQLIIRGGHLMLLAVIPLSLLLTIWTLKMYRLEFRSQTDILQVLGWPADVRRNWLLLDIGFLLFGAVIITSLLTAVLYWGLLPTMTIAPLLEDGFKL